VVQESESIKPNHLQKLPLFIYKLWLLKKELELTELSEQIYRLRKRLALSKFFDVYTDAQTYVYSHLHGEDGENVIDEPPAKRRRRDRNL